VSVQHVQIVPADEQYAPPGEVVELAVVGDGGNPERPLVLLTLVKYEETGEGSTSKIETNFPALYLEDVVRGLGAFAVAGQQLHLSHGIPYQLPAAPAEEPQA
jgi:hypothetical protein